MDKKLLEKLNNELDELIKEYDDEGGQYELIASGLKIAKEKINYEVYIYGLVKDLEK